MLDDFAIDLSLDLRVNPYKKLYTSLKAGTILSAPEISGFWKHGVSAIWGGALEIAYDAISGPIKFDLQYSNAFGLGAYLSFGYDF